MEQYHQWPIASAFAVGASREPNREPAEFIHAHVMSAPVLVMIGLDEVVIVSFSGEGGEGLSSLPV
jgi:hypothetical protein